jgi:hypothetical protein
MPRAEGASVETDVNECYLPNFLPGQMKFEYTILATCSKLISTVHRFLANQHEPHYTGSCIRVSMTRSVA